MTRGRPKKRRQCRGCRRVCSCVRKLKPQPRAEPLWRLLLAVDRFRMEREERPWGVDWRVTLVDAEGNRSEGLAARPQEAFYLALGRPLEKRCRGHCKQVLPLGHFNVNEKYSDGLDSKCAGCEARRKHDQRLKKKGDKLRKQLKAEAREMGEFPHTLDADESILVTTG